MRKSNCQPPDYVFSNEVPQESVLAMHPANSFISILEVNHK